MRFTQAVAVLAAACAMTTSSAMAQMPGGSSMMFKGGISNPTKSPVKDAGNSWWTGGLEYALGNPEARSVRSFEALYSSKSKDVKAAGLSVVPSHYKIISLMLNQKIRSVGPDGIAMGNVLFYGAGLGAQIVKMDVQDSNPGGVTIDKTKTVAGGNVFIGYDMASNLQIEAKYQFGFSKVEDRDISMLQFLVGLKF